MDEKILRDYLRRALDSHEAHVAWKKAVADVPVKYRGTRPRREARVASMARGLLACPAGAAESSSMGKEREVSRTGPGSDGETRGQPENRSWAARLLWIAA